MHESSNEKNTIAIFGATGYIGLILTHHLDIKDYRLKLFIRDKTRLNYLKESHKFLMCDTPIIRDNLAKIAKELEGIDVIYYLIHSMEKNIKSFSDTDNLIASIIGEAAHRANVKQIIYVGGLGKPDEKHDLSKHLKSRQVTATYLNQFGVPLTEFRTGIVTGEGSASFEMIRTLSTKLPFIPIIPFNNGVCQIIDIDDLITFLDDALNDPVYFDQIIEIGTTYAYNYNELIMIFARVIKKRNLKLINLPILNSLFTESVVARLISWFTRIPFQLAKPLIAGMKSLAVVDKYPIEATDPDSTVICRTFEKSILKASSYRDEITFEGFWKIPKDIQFYLKHKRSGPSFSQYTRNGLFFSTLIHKVPYHSTDTIFENAKLMVHKSQFQHTLSQTVILTILNTLFKREKPYSTSSSLTLSEGSTCKEWRVAAMLQTEEQAFITLSSQFKNTGFLWFQFSITKMDNKDAYVMLRIFFEPISISGHLYWNLAKRLHASILKNMFNAIATPSTQ